MWLRRASLMLTSDPGDGQALSPFPCDGTMAHLGRHSEPGPHRTMLAGLAPGEEGGGTSGVHS